MWYPTFDQRLASWVRLRDECASMALPLALANINTWWHKTPWTPYYLHWDDRLTWPDPWQLLDDNIFCPVARGLGMLYTISLLDRADMQDACLIEGENHNLVQVQGGKYILNWDRENIVNISLSPRGIRNRITQQQVKQRIR